MGLHAEVARYGDDQYTGYLARPDRDFARTSSLFSRLLSD